MKNSYSTALPEVVVAGGIYLMSATAVASQMAIKGRSCYPYESARIGSESILSLQFSVESRKETFQKLAEQWRDATGHFSIVQQAISHPLYLQIIGMTERALPFLIEDTLNGLPIWLPALRAIAGEERPKEGNSFPETVEAWRSWWRERSTKYEAVDSSG